MDLNMEKEHGRITLEKDIQGIGEIIKQMVKVNMCGALVTDMKGIGWIS